MGQARSRDRSTGISGTNIIQPTRDADRPNQNQRILDFEYGIRTGVEQRFAIRLLDRNHTRTDSFTQKGVTQRCAVEDRIPGHDVLIEFEVNTLVGQVDEIDDVGTRDDVGNARGTDYRRANHTCRAGIDLLAVSSIGSRDGGRSLAD